VTFGLVQNFKTGNPHFFYDFHAQPSVHPSISADFADKPVPPTWARSSVYLQT
jgi:hypothetical protein